jgi:hypothetical protein
VRQQTARGHRQWRVGEGCVAHQVGAGGHLPQQVIGRVPAQEGCPRLVRSHAQVHARRWLSLTYYDKSGFVAVHVPGPPGAFRLPAGRPGIGPEARTAVARIRRIASSLPR